jgi:hypothetical protein
MGEAGAPMVVVTAAMVALLAFGAVGGATRAGQGIAHARRVGAVVGLTLGAWLAVTAGLAIGGVLDVSARPPRWPLLPLTAFVAIALVMRSASASRVLSAVPLAWPIAAQTFRVGVELALFALHAAGLAPVRITFEGRNFDVVVGLSAPWIAWLLAKKRIGSRGAVGWNVLGLAVLANTVGTVASSTPGPLHLNGSGAPFTAIATWPIVWLPAFLMPTAVFLHVVSLRQNLRRLRAASSVPHSSPRSSLTSSISRP